MHLDHTSFIDGTIPSTKVLIEQKGLGKDLKKPIKQSDGTLLTPFQQAKRYITELPLSQHPRWVVTCNFEKFFVYDMERPGGEPEEILLKNLEIEYYRLQFLVDEGSEHLKREMEVSIAAGEMVGLLYDAFHKQYADPDSEHSLKSLNILCVRLVFCLYAEDAGIFGHHGMFHDYLAEYSTRHMRKALVELFKVLDTTPENRDPYLKDDNPQLAAFPYVNGGLFANEDIEIPPFTDEIRALLLDKASTDFNWSEISPTIFGAVFESTLNPVGQLVDLYREYDNEHSATESIKNAADGVFRVVLGMTAEQFQYQNLWWIYEKFNRDYYILLAGKNFEHRSKIDTNAAVKEVFGCSVDDYIAILLMIFWLCSQHPDPLSAPESLYCRKENTILTTENITKFIGYYSCDYKELREDSLGKQLLYSKPFIKTQRYGVYLAVSMYLVSMMVGNGLYWLVRDYYFKQGTQKFVNAFGLLFEDYIKDLPIVISITQGFTSIPKAKS